MCSSDLFEAAQHLGDDFVGLDRVGVGHYLRVLLAQVRPVVPAYNPTVSSPALTVTNQISNPIQDMWFYFEGNISDVKLKDADVGTIYNGTGLGNR